MSNELDVFVDTTKVIHAMEIPSKEKAEMLVRTALRMVLDDLADKNIEGAITVYNQYSTIEQYFKRQHADLVTQNTMGVGRLRLIRPIGQYIKDEYYHGSTINGRTKNGDYSFVSEYQTNKRLGDLPITHHTYTKWIDASTVTEEEFEKWAVYYMGNDPERPLKEEDDVHFMLFLRKFFSAKYGGDTSGPSLLPHMKRAYNAWEEIIAAYQVMVQATADGNTPIEQINIVREQMNKAVEVVNDSLKKIGELYK